MKPILKPEQIRKPARPAWLNWRVVMIFVILGVLMMAMAMSEPLPGRRDLITNQLAMRFDANATVQMITPTSNHALENAQTATVVVNPLVTPSPTPIPEEWLTNREMADGIVLGAVALVLIVLGGTFSVIRRRP